MHMISTELNVRVSFGSLIMLSLIQDKITIDVIVLEFS